MATMDDRKARVLKSVCERLLRYDPDIVEIVLFGSSVYMPERSRDIDLLIFTRKVKKYSGYIDVAYEDFPPLNIDLSIVEVGAKLRGGFAWCVMGAYEILYGDGTSLREATKEVGDPTLEEAYSYLRGAKEHIELVETAISEVDKERHVRMAFENLFHAARVASMVLLATENTRWGVVRRRLPASYKSRFDEFVDTLHINYFYHGNYPRERVREEFERWFHEVKGYVEDVAAEIERR